ncbi:cytochrome c3 family protein [Rubrivirga sp. IMCC43871]|uniref:cytochrome c3 family protein n=1 Tax=Rubrivirga sp. IMCC43871 TaxID=3391575 RepID=UPI003990324F
MPQLFPRKANALPTASLFGALGGGLLVVLLAWYYLSPEFYEVGYQPEQPVEYSHAFHAGQLGMDCRYCHNHVEQSPHANVPSTQTCMNCHGVVATESAKLLPVRESWATGVPVEWVKVHHIPDYAQFSHTAHVNVGVGCESCHGRVDQMEVVSVVEPLSMGWCLECHRAPEEHLRDPALVTQMGLAEAVRADDETYEAYVAANIERIEAEGIAPPQNCSACHY